MTSRNKTMRLMWLAFKLDAFDIFFVSRISISEGQRVRIYYGLRNALVLDNVTPLQIQRLTLLLSQIKINAYYFLVRCECINKLYYNTKRSERQLSRSE